METVVGIFKTRAESYCALDYLKSAGIPDERLTVLSPGASGETLEEVPTTDTEQPGVGEAIGGVVGGALGAAGGMSLGASAATFLVPGVGPVLAVGLLGAALLGAGGALGGATLGGALEAELEQGLPKDEWFIYEDALRKGRSVVVVLTSARRQADAVRRILEQAGAEGIDSAREDWWVGLRDAEREHYAAGRRDFETDEPTYRLGFEAAMHPEIRGRAYEEVKDDLMARYPDAYAEDAFRRGFERGGTHCTRLMKRFGKSA